MATPTQKRLIQKRLTDIRTAKNTPWSKRFEWTGFFGKTLWDWLNVLGVFLIPIVVVGATIGFGWWQAHLADVQHQQDQQGANLQHQQDQASVLDQQRAAILQTYMDNIQDLLLNHHLLVSKSTDDVAVLARARTLTALQGLDSGRKGSLVKFIYEAQLIGFLDSTGKLHGTIIDLNGADLGGARLFGADLSYTHLNGAILNYANLNGADLDNADLNGADLNGADLNDAHLNDAHLNDAHLSGAHLGFAQNLTQRQLDQVFTCQGAILPQGLTCHHNLTI
jgi:uncharacterized protein YjbI with pentapeptide repeats